MFVQRLFADLIQTFMPYIVCCWMNLDTCEADKSMTKQNFIAAVQNVKHDELLVNYLFNSVFIITFDLSTNYQSTDNYQFFVWDAVVLLKLLRMKVYCLSLLNSFEMTCKPLSADWLLEFDRLLNRRNLARWLLSETCPSSSLSS